MLSKSLPKFLWVHPLHKSGEPQAPHRNPWSGSTLNQYSSPMTNLGDMFKIRHKSSCFQTLKNSLKTFSRVTAVLSISLNWLTSLQSTWIYTLHHWSNLRIPEHQPSTQGLFSSLPRERGGGKEGGETLRIRLTWPPFLLNSNTTVLTNFLEDKGHYCYSVRHK